MANILEEKLKENNVPWGNKVLLTGPTPKQDDPNTRVCSLIAEDKVMQQLQKQYTMVQESFI